VVHRTHPARAGRHMPRGPGGPGQAGWHSPSPARTAAPNGTLAPAASSNAPSKPRSDDGRVSRVMAPGGCALPSPPGGANPKPASKPPSIWSAGATGRLPRHL